MEGLKLIRIEKPEIVTLDLMLPGLDGMTICGMVKESPDKYGNPVIVMLKAKTETDDVIKGLTYGADEYMKKPFDPREVVARIENIVRRKKGMEMGEEVIRYKTIEVYPYKHTIKDDGKEIDFSKKEYDLFLYLLKNKGLVLSRDKILDKIWGSSYYSGDRTVDVYIAKLREKLQSISKHIRTIKGVGYKLEEEKK